MVICFIIQVYWPSSEFYATINSLYVITYIDILYTGMKIIYKYYLYVTVVYTTYDYTEKCAT